MTTRANELTALVTGATAGLGAEFARQLAEAGHHLVLVARDEERLKEKAEELERDFSISAEVLPADLTTDVGVSAVADRLRDAARPVDVLVNNAGIGLLKSFERNDLDEERRHLRLHVQTPMELSHAALEVMLARGKGRIINVASVAAFANRYLLRRQSVASDIQPVGQHHLREIRSAGHRCLPRFHPHRIPRPYGHGQNRCSPPVLVAHSRAGSARGAGGQRQGQGCLHPYATVQSGQFLCTYPASEAHLGPTPPASARAVNLRSGLL